MKRRSLCRKICIFVLALVLGTTTAHAQNGSNAVTLYSARWQILRTCVLDCTILSNRVASIFTDAVAAQANKKLKVTATLTEYDIETDTWTDLCSITDTAYGEVTVETDYVIPNREGVYYNRTNIVTYNDNGSVAERIELYSEPQYYPGP